MTRIVSPARSADGRPTKPINGRRRPLARTGTLAPWIASAIAAFVLLMLIFVLQNGQASQVHFLGLNGQLPMGVAMLLAAVAGVLLVSIPAVARLVRARMLAGRVAPETTIPAEPTGPVA
ncbi:LapA family protein [Micromonospora sp. NPDC049523]|uniref:LapA family protein n=1 Tax=Micromonospora sp. NPDC049523 TaxID=3155921 RepID=UPI003435A490